MSKSIFADYSILSRNIACAAFNLALGHIAFDVYQHSGALAAVGTWVGVQLGLAVLFGWQEVMRRNKEEAVDVS